jgi:hypothetical protein
MVNEMYDAAEQVMRLGATLTPDIRDLMREVGHLLDSYADNATRRHFVEMLALFGDICRDGATCEDLILLRDYCADAIEHTRTLTNGAELRRVVYVLMAAEAYFVTPKHCIEQHPNLSRRCPLETVH